MQLENHVLEREKGPGGVSILCPKLCEAFLKT